MTIGHVTANGHAQIQIVVEDSNEGTHDVEALLDTGFNGALALPAQRIASLGLKRRGQVTAVLASGEEHNVPTYRATVRIGGTRHSVVVAEAGESLVGMRLLWGFDLGIQCIDGGKIDLERLS
jgi:clan AA aspartic protease